MKKPTIFNITLLSTLLTQATLAVEQRPHNGYWWQCIGNECLK